MTLGTTTRSLKKEHMIYFILKILFLNIRKSPVDKLVKKMFVVK